MLVAPRGQRVKHCFVLLLVVYNFLDQHVPVTI